MGEWVAPLAEGITRMGRAVLVTIAHAAGSTPRAAGTAMVVTADHIAGTIGGGHLEYEATRIARDALGNVALPPPWVVRFPLAARLGQCCGGVATLAFTVADASAARWLDDARACLRADTAFVLVSRVGGAGSAHLVVTADAATGTLGDSRLDALGTAHARAQLATAIAGAHLVDGGHPDSATLLLLVVEPRPFDVLVFGNGHVGRALVQVLGALPAHVRWIDERDEDFPQVVAANVEVIATDTPGSELQRAPASAYLVVMTHSHALDYDLVEAALRRDDWSYVGLIGSKSKRNQFEKRLRARGVADDVLARVVCPIGVRGTPILRSKEPGVIAVAVAAEMLAIREQRNQATLSSSAASLTFPGTACV